MYAKPRKDKAKTQVSRAGGKSPTTKAYDVVLFATEGPGLESISLWELLDWFMPFHLNASLSACKAFARIELGACLLITNHSSE